MTQEPYPSVYCYVTFNDRVTGAEHVHRYVTVGPDHAAAARQAFESMSGYMGANVREIVTFDGEPRRWSPQHEVEEILPRGAS